MQLKIVNNCGFDLTNCTARLASSDPNIDCIIGPVLNVGNIADEETIDPTTESFLFRVADVTTTDPFNPLTGTFDVTISCDQIDAADIAQKIVLPLDLDLTPFGVQGSYNEDFEGNAGDIGDTFFVQDLDNGLPGNNDAEGLLNSDGWRCQYNDPDWVNGGAYASAEGEDCYPAQNLAHSQQIWWQKITTRSYGFGIAGTQAMYFGSEQPNPGEFTQPVGVVEAAGTSSSAPINLGVDAPILTFYHQTSMVDGRGVGATPDTWSAERIGIQARVINNNGDPVGSWLKLEPFQNGYDSQAGDNFFNCEFDPVDDGNNEDDFFDPSDPGRDQGPSSTCLPEFTFSCMGDTDNDTGLNAISFTSEHSGTQTVIGRGAGGIETASSILRDLLDIREEISKP